MTKEANMFTCLAGLADWAGPGTPMVRMVAVKG